MPARNPARFWTAAVLRRSRFERETAFEPCSRFRTKSAGGPAHFFKSFRGWRELKCALGISLLVALVLFAAFSGFGQSVSNAFWQAQSIYQIITDRYYDGDPSNNNAEGNYNPSGTSGTSVHGGDFKGIEKKLDYIKALGATAIWISPVVKNANGEFHGYAAQDFYAVAPHFGSLADLQHLIQTAHSKGLLVIDDIVCNHGGDLTMTDTGSTAYEGPPGYSNLVYRSASKQFAFPFNTNAINPRLTNIFHNNGNIGNFNDDTQVVLGELSGLDDFRTETDYVRTNMANIYSYWISNGFDGFRIDTVKHVDMGFWQTWCPVIHHYAATNNGKANFFTFGECEDGSDTKCGSYTGAESGGPFCLESMLDYPLYFQINNVFASASGNTKAIEDHYNAIVSNYDPAAQMRLVTFLDNHDQPRFMSVGGATSARLNVALAFLYTARGVPCLYYGTEQAFNGTTDPNDREDMFDGQFEQGPSVGDNFNMTHPQFLWIAKLNNFRRLYPALQIGSHVNKWNNPSGPGLFAYARRFFNGTYTQEVFTVFNTSTSTQTLTNRSTAFLPGTQIVNLFDTNEVLTVTATPEIPPITVPGTSVKIFVAKTDWRALDPLVISNSPGHDGASIPTYLPIVLQFSDPMETNSVQTNFSTSPAISGNFGWNAARDTMTFTPAGSGLPGLSTITVRVTNGVSAVSGNSMFAPYEMFFKTATPSSQDTTPPTISIISPTNQAVASAALSISGTAFDNAAVQKVEMCLDSGPWVTASGLTSWSYSLNTSNFLNGRHYLSARATDTSGNMATNSISVKFFNVPGAYLQRYAAGNPSNVVDCNSLTWPRDVTYSFGSSGYSGGTTGYVANAITGICTAAQTLYQRERYSTNPGGFYFQFDCPEGIYETTLLEAETYWSGVGQRVFNVYIQGSQILTNFDIFKAAGGKNLPINRVFTNTVSNCRLQVLFTPVIDNARLSGIQVRKIADVCSDTDGIPDWWRLAYFGHAVGLAEDHSRASDDADGDGVSNLNEFLAGTDPTSASSVLLITKVLPSEGDMQISCSTVTNHWYQLQRRTGVSSGDDWINIGPLAPGSGGPMVLTDPGGATNSTEIYRVQVY